VSETVLVIMACLAALYLLFMILQGELGVLLLAAAPALVLVMVGLGLMWYALHF